MCMHAWGAAGREAGGVCVWRGRGREGEKGDRVLAEEREDE